MKKPRIKENYRYVLSPDRGLISAGARFAGKWVWGHAICHPEDEFDEDFGKKLAAARCNQKIAELRWKRAKKRYEEARRAVAEVHVAFDEACDYLTNSYDRRRVARDRVINLLAQSAAEDVNLFYAGECAHDCF